MKFYGQFEPQVDQYIFERYFPDVGIEGVFVECGAFDGLTECSCKFFEETMGWKGYNFEPVPLIFKELQINRPLSTNLNYGLSNNTGKAIFHAVNHPTFGLNCTNGSLQHQDSHKAILDEMGCDFHEIEVELITWAKFIKDFNVKRVDLLVLDVEGHELSVIEAMRDCDVLPDIICIEYGHLGLGKVREHLEPLGYCYDITSNANAFFVKHEKIPLFALRRTLKMIPEQKEKFITTQTVPIDYKLIEENTSLKVHLSDLTHLYNEIIGSKSWRMIESVKKIWGSK